MNIKRMIKVIIFAVLVLAVGSLLTSLLQFRDKDMSKLNQYNKDTEYTNFNYVFLGSSHIYANVNPTIIDEILNVNSYDAAYANMKMSQAYYLLKEVLRHDDVDMVAVEMYSLFNPIHLNTQKKARISTDMEWSKNKWEYLTRVFGWPYIVDHYIPLLRCHNNYSNPTTISENLAAFGEQIPLPDGYYHGFEYKETEMSQELFMKNLHTPTVNKEYYTLSARKYKNYDEELGYLCKIIELCQDSGIEVILLKTPVISYFGSIEQYAQYYTSVSEETATQYGINTIDYNYLSNALGLDYTYFRDIGHLNKKGAAKLSAHFANYYKALHNPELRSNANLIKNPFIQADPKRGTVSASYDEKYGSGVRVEKTYSAMNYDRIATLDQENLTQPGADYLPYTLTCVIKNTSGVKPEELINILTLYNGLVGCDRYQYRTIEPLEGDYYQVTVSLESNIGSFIDICVNSNLPKNKPVEIYQIELKQDFR